MSVVIVSTYTYKISCVSLEAEYVECNTSVCIDHEKCTLLLVARC